MIAIDELWFSPGEIVFRREQVEWLLLHYESISKGFWPPEPREVIRRRGTRRRRWGYFESPMEVMAEFNPRLAQTGVDGKLLIAEIRLVRTADDLQPEARRALNYISGMGRKKQSYLAWKRQRKYYENIGNRPLDK